ncbi:MAG: caspase family protein, partial [Pseudomonadota bacterium]
MTLALIPFLALILTACDGIELPRSSQSDLAVEDQGAATTVTRTEQSGTTARTPSELPEEQFKDEVGSIDASPGDRYALLIGNEAYPREVGPLTLPHEDVESVAAALLQSGFPEDNITIIKDADRGEMLRSIRVFKSALQNTEKKGVGFFYYSGHGGSSESGGNRENFLLPSNELITDASELRDNGVSVSNLLTDMAQTEARAVFVISDACRNTLPITSEKGGGADKGMVREPRRGGLFIAFATADGQTTKDDGLFARVLASELPIPNRGYYETFKAVQNRISQERDLAKQPYVMDGITGQFCFLSCAPSFKRDDIPAIESLDTEEAQAWKAALEPISIDAIASYLEGYPNGAYAEYAKLLVSLREVADEAVETIDEFSKELFVQDYFRDDFDSFNPVVLQVVEHLLSEKTGLGYSLQSNGFTEDLIFGDEILVGGNGTTNTVSIVQEVLVRSMSLWAQ